MNTPNFKIGDEVRIKTWEQMETEFGSVYGDIECDGTFVEKMKYLCGKEFTITKIDEEYVQEIDGWTITFDMIEHMPERLTRPEAYIEYQVTVTRRVPVTRELTAEDISELQENFYDCDFLDFENVMEWNEDEAIPYLHYDGKTFNQF